MTKKHYEAIASILYHARDIEQYENHHAPIITQASENLADYFATDNPKFDRARFLQACGVQRYAGSKQEMEDNSFIDDVLKS